MYTVTGYGMQQGKLDVAYLRYFLIDKMITDATATKEFIYLLTLCMPYPDWPKHAVGYQTLSSITNNIGLLGSARK